MWRDLAHAIEYDPTWPASLPGYCGECDEALADGATCGYNQALLALAAEQRAQVAERVLAVAATLEDPRVQRPGMQRRRQWAKRLREATQ